LFGFEDEEPNSLAFQEQLADRFLEKVVADLGGNCQIENADLTTSWYKSRAGISLLVRPLLARKTQSRTTS
jgi:hypothetical protein